jgi:hypothetical protein
VEKAAAIWPVFIPWYQHADSGHPFQLNEYVTWPVVLVETDEWPAELTVTQSVHFPKTDGPTVAQAGQVRASWRGPVPAARTAEFRGLLLVDHLKAPFPAVRGQVLRIRLLRRQHVFEPSGGAIPTWARWSLIELERSVEHFQMRPAGGDMLADSGLLVNLRIDMEGPSNGC